MIIKSKKDWYQINELFNHPRTFTIADFIKQYDPEIYYTTQNRQVTGAPFYRLKGTEMVDLINTGALDYGYRIIEAVPPIGINVVVQGEFDGIHGRVTMLNEPMRSALLASQTHIDRKQLFGYVGARFYSEIMDISMMFPDHIIEFSIYDQPIGAFKSNMLIWEVRNY